MARGVEANRLQGSRCARLNRADHAIEDAQARLHLLGRDAQRRAEADRRLAAARAGAARAGTRPGSPSRGAPALGRSAAVISPSPRTPVSAACLPDNSRSPARSCSPRAAALAMYSRSSRSMRRQGRPAARPGCRRRCWRGCRGGQSMTCALAMIAPSGIPLAMPLAEADDVRLDARSARRRTSCRCGPCPICTSSTTSRMPCLSHSCRSAGRKPARQQVIAALALDRLDEDGRHFLRRAGALEERVFDFARCSRHFARRRAADRAGRARGECPAPAARSRGDGRASSRTATSPRRCGRGTRRRTRPRGCARCASGRASAPPPAPRRRCW